MRHGLRRHRRALPGSDRRRALLTGRHGNAGSAVSATRSRPSPRSAGGRGPRPTPSRASGHDFFDGSSGVGRPHSAPTRPGRRDGGVRRLLARTARQAVYAHGRSHLSVATRFSTPVSTAPSPGSGQPPPTCPTPRSSPAATCCSAPPRPSTRGPGPCSLGSNRCRCRTIHTVGCRPRGRIDPRASGRLATWRSLRVRRSRPSAGDERPRPRSGSAIRSVSTRRPADSGPDAVDAAAERLRTRGSGRWRCARRPPDAPPDLDDRGEHRCRPTAR